MRKNNGYVLFVFSVFGLLGGNSISAMRFLRHGAAQDGVDRNADLVSLLQKTAPYAAVVIKLGLPFDLENGIAMSYRMDNGLADTQTSTPRSVYASSFLKAIGCYALWHGTKQGFEKMTGHPLAIPAIDCARYRRWSLKRGAARVANLGIWGVNTGADLAGPLAISYLINTVGQRLDKDEE